jgi:hypothetical protein
MSISYHFPPIREKRTPRKVIEGTVDAGGTLEWTSLLQNIRLAASVTVRVTYDASATKGVRVYFLHSPDETNFDTPEDAESQGNYVDVTFAAGATRQVTVPVAYPGICMRIRVKNLDTSYPATVTVWLAEVG